MTAPKGFRPADLGGEPTEIPSRPEYRAVTIKWSTPKPWGPNDEEVPIGKIEQQPDYLYAISWGHHRAERSETIAYIGITKNLATRFDNHPKAKALRERKRKNFLSVGQIDFERIRTHSERTKAVTEELEHLLIWALWPELENEKKMLCIPGFGMNGGGAWHVTNIGHRFRGRMPREIVFPWMIVRPGRDRSRKS